MIHKFTRREFMNQTTLSCFSMALAPNYFLSNILEQDEGSIGKSGTLRISPRYYRWHVDRGVEWLETNTSYNYLDWRMPVTQVGLVLLDLWQRHYLKDTEERTEKVIDDKLVPLL